MDGRESSAARMIDAAEHLMETEGISGVTVRSVARASGLSHGAPRRYFPTLAALHAAVAQRGLQDLRRRIEREVGENTEPAARLRAAALAYVRYAVERPDMFALVFRHDILANSGMHLRGTSLPLFAFVTDLVEPLAGTDTHVRAVQIWTAVHGIAALSSTTALSVVTEVDSTALVDAAVESIVDTNRGDPNREGPSQPAMDFTDAGS
ncbi:TetR/AcrR family transcriptional regulator [Rhodococcoides fascians]|jgi:AcrR family transcriptional regulator|uniref:TetR/AcrR family transcriptional regulator n=1 Tax=Rhodococcoides fascians TaxID=1828 RepID=UPI00055A2B27|nr:MULTISPECIES: TetR/AcrR family transcriptional regulator [Rhodococcus]OZE94694.1 TetR/AcrR family transcriptional regulator [Rhodococcus sp. 15-1189-1-1a]OZF09004.1 TetR/AcrR family transcriptional regulator [Rhodococcus sp. 14-2686-1-2]